MPVVRLALPTPDELDAFGSRRTPGAIVRIDSKLRLRGILSKTADVMLTAVKLDVGSIETELSVTSTVSDTALTLSDGFNVICDPSRTSTLTCLTVENPVLETVMA